MRWVKVAAIVAACVVVLAAASVGAAIWLADRKSQRVVDVDVAPLRLAGDASNAPHGKYLFDTRGCADCHGARGEGHVMLDSGGLFVRAPDITTAHSGVASRYTDRDWVRALRHGVKPDGRPVQVMPSEDYARMTDEDVAALVTYVRSLPAGPATPAEIRLPVIVKALYAVGVVHDAAERIDHRLPPSQPVPVAVSVAHGEYVANMCKGCHRPTLVGGKIEGAPPDWPPASDITASSPAMTRYDSATKLASMFRTGKRPDGSAVSSVMPFSSLRVLDDTDVAALHLYLRQTAPPTTRGS